MSMSQFAAPRRRDFSSWLATGLQLVGAFLLASRLASPPVAYALMGGGSIGWGLIAATRRDWPLAALNVGFTALNLLGWVRWTA